MLFLFFFPPIALDKTSHPILNKSGKSRDPGPFSDLRGKTFSFFIVEYVFINDKLYYVEVCSLYTSFIKFFSKMDFTKEEPRWQRNRMGRPLSLLQIHQKNN